MKSSSCPWEDVNSSCVCPCLSVTGILRDLLGLPITLSFGVFLYMTSKKHDTALCT